MSSVVNGLNRLKKQTIVNIDTSRNQLAFYESQKVIIDLCYLLTVFGMKDLMIADNINRYVWRRQYGNKTRI